MKELIKKIISYTHGYIESIDDLKEDILKDLKQIQDNELKKFNPVECGFLITETTLNMLKKDPNIDVLEFDFKKPNEIYVMRLFKSESKILITHYYNGDDYRIIVNLIKIHNHRFGVELLQGLGIIK